MAKKKTKSRNNDILASNEFTTLEVGEDLKPESAPSSKIEDDDLDDLLEDAESKKTLVEENDEIPEFLPRLTQEMKEKLDKAELVSKHCIELEEINSKLGDTVNSQAEEIEVLKAKLADSAKISAESLEKENSELRRTVKDLREENDSYLMKISELTFENAKLTSRMQEIEKSLSMASSPTHGNAGGRSSIKPSIATMPNQAKYSNPYLHNGYQDW